MFDRRGRLVRKRIIKWNGQEQNGTEIKNWQMRAEGCGSMLLLLPCNSSRGKVVDKSKRQKRMVFIVQKGRVFICVIYLWIGVRSRK